MENSDFTQPDDGSNLSEATGGAEINFSYILLLIINDCNRARVQGNKEAFKEGVETLYDNLSDDFDDKFMKKLRILKAAQEKRIWGSVSGKTPEEKKQLFHKKLKENEHNFCRGKFRALMQLARRRNLLPEKSVNVEGGF